MAYYYEMHLHTGIGSKCGRLTPEEVVRLYTALGFTGVFVTDHFLNGNTAFDRSLPWEEKIRLYASATEQVKAAAAGTGLDVFFGIEYHVGGGAECLLYGATPEFLLAHEEIMDMEAREVLDFFRSSGIAVFQAHPMREASYIPALTIYPKSVDGIEVYNGGNTDRANAFAAEYARLYELPTIAGSDIHHVGTRKIVGYASPIRLEKPTDILDAVKMEGSSYQLFENPLEL